MDIMEDLLEWVGMVLYILLSCGAISGVFVLGREYLTMWDSLVTMSASDWVLGYLIVFLACCLVSLLMMALITPLVYIYNYIVTKVTR